MSLRRRLSKQRQRDSFKRHESRVFAPWGPRRRMRPVVTRNPHKATKSGSSFVVPMMVACSQIGRTWMVTPSRREQTTSTCQPKVVGFVK